MQFIKDTSSAIFFHIHHGELCEQWTAYFKAIQKYLVVGELGSRHRDNLQTGHPFTPEKGVENTGSSKTECFK